MHSYFKLVIIGFVKINESYWTFLVLLSKFLELAKNIGSISLRKSFLLVATIISLPDVWDIFEENMMDIWFFLS